MAKRLTILSKKEIKEIYSLPIFSYEERCKYFTIKPLEKEELDNLYSLTSKIYFLLQLGYFKAKKMFFKYSIEEIEDDIKYIAQYYFKEENISLFSEKELSRTTKWNIHSSILKIYKYKVSTQNVCENLQEKSLKLVKIYSKPIYIFRALITYLENNKIVIPGYSTLQDIIANAINTENERLKLLVSENINDKIKSALNDLLSVNNNIQKLTSIKKEPRNFKYKEITTEVNKQITLEPLYSFACSFLPKLGISNENIKYYSSLVDFYSVYRLKHLKRKLVYIYLLSFIFNRYHKINNNLINSLIHHVTKYSNEAKTKAKEKVYYFKSQGNKHLKNAGKVLDLFINDKYPDDIRFGEVKKYAFQLLQEDKFKYVSKYLSKTSFDETEYEWNHYINLALTFKKNLRPILSTINPESLTKNDSLIDAVNFLKSAISNNKSLSKFKEDDIPQDFIPNKLKKYIYDSKTFINNGKKFKIKELNFDKYEYLICICLKNGFESGDIFCKDSTLFRSFEDELIEKEYWEKNKDTLLNNLDYPRLKISIKEYLSNLEEELENKVIEVNKHIAEGSNKYIKITGKGDNVKWSLPYKKMDDTENHTFYSHVSQVGIGDIIQFVNKECGFIDSFSHILGKYVKTKADDVTIIACIIALATNTGLDGMGSISDINSQSLKTAANNYIRLETLRRGNDKISNEIAKNPFFRNYDIKEGIVHSSSDGQKFETRIKTINARYSPKYFGLKEGVTSYTLIANHVPANAKIIGANDHESHFVFDILFNNTSEIKPDRHSTDSHGVNNANFLILDLFDYMFAPRYKDLCSKVDKICAFKKLINYSNYFIKPSRKANKQIILDEEDNIKRIMVSLALKTTTQSIIVRKLSSHLRKNKTKKAIWELNTILNSNYLLEYVDDIILRQNVQKAINRNESYHKLRRAVSHANFGKFHVKTEHEQQIWNECARLVSNCIIFYNTWILSNLHKKLLDENKTEAAEFISKVSPVAWRHINLRGNFEFQKIGTVNLNNIIDNLFEMTAKDFSTENEFYFDSI